MRKNILKAVKIIKIFIMIIYFEKVFLELHTYHRYL